MLKKIKKKKWTREKKDIVTAAYEAVIYNTWIARNMTIFKKERYEKAFVL